MKTFFRYLTSAVLVGIISYLIISGLFNFINSIDILNGISFHNIINYSFLITGFILLTYHMQNFLKIYKTNFSLNIFNVPNPFYDSKYDNSNFLNFQSLKEDNDELLLQKNNLLDLINNYMEEVSKKDEELSDFQYVSEIYIRHHKNSSRLVRSLTSLINENNNDWSTEFYNNVLDECVTVLQLDRADKSSAIYFIENNKLIMVGYNRINFSSSRTRSFSKGEGFAGNVWDSDKTLLENSVEDSEYFTGPFTPKHSYGSIIGTPIRINTEIIGVLCIQSEGYNGFDEADSDTIQYYADICALAYYYDKIKID